MFYVGNLATYWTTHFGCLSRRQPFILSAMLRSLLFCLVLLFSSIATASETQWFTDKTRELPPLLADPTEAQMKLGYLWRENKKSFLEVALGGQLGIVRQDLEDGAWALQGRAFMHSRFEFFSHSFDHQDSDFVGGFSFAYRKSKTVYELLLSHQSSHLGDDIQSRNLRRPINYSYEYARFIYSYTFSPELRLYSGVQISYRADPALLLWKPMWIIGGEVRPVSGLPELFFGTHCRFNGVHHYAPILSIATGYELGNAKNSVRRQRIQFEVYNGYSDLGQYFEHREFYLFLGVLFTL